jgi:hypothetical protein
VGGAGGFMSGLSRRGPAVSVVVSTAAGAGAGALTGLIAGSIAQAAAPKPLVTASYYGAGVPQSVIPAYSRPATAATFGG